MHLPPTFRRAVLALIIAGLAATPLLAQNILFTEMDGKLLAVRRARGNEPFVLIGDKLTPAPGRRYILRKTEEFLPEFVSVRDLEVRTRYLDVEGSAINNDFLFNAKLESPYALADVFIVLELDTDAIGKVLFLQEVGNLAARQQKSLNVRVPLTGTIGEGHYKFHLFAGGRELLHSNMPPQMRDAAVDRMTFKLIAGTQDAMPRILVGPEPEFPGALLKTRTQGHVVIAMRVGRNGQVYDPKVKEASDPAFGESALTAVRLWRFLPKVSKGHPVESVVEVPIEFTPPPPSEKKA